MRLFWRSDEGQFSIAVPAHDLVVVRLGVSPSDERLQNYHLKLQLGKMIDELCAGEAGSAERRGEAAGSANL